MYIALYKCKIKIH